MQAINTKERAYHHLLVDRSLCLTSPLTPFDRLEATIGLSDPFQSRSQDAYL